MTRLTYLFVYGNKLSGNISIFLFSLTQLTKLDRSNNKFTYKISKVIIDLAQLNYLDLYENKLTSGIPMALGNLTQLTSLYLLKNKLTRSIHVTFTSLQHFQKLLFSKNMEGLVLDDIGNCILMMVFFSYSNNSLRELPPSLANWTQLQLQDLRKNGLTEKLLQYLTSFHKLRPLHIIICVVVFLNRSQISTNCRCWIYPTINSMEEYQYILKGSLDLFLFMSISILKCNFLFMSIPILKCDFS